MQRAFTTYAGWFTNDERKVDAGIKRISGPLLSKWMNKEKTIGHPGTWRDFTTFLLTELDRIDRLRESAERVYGDARQRANQFKETA